MESERSELRKLENSKLRAEELLRHMRDLDRSNINYFLQIDMQIMDELGNQIDTFTDRINEIKNEVSPPDNRHWRQVAFDFLFECLISDEEIPF